METKTSRLLLDEPPLVILPQLAVKIGLNEAIALQQVHYWTKGYEVVQSKGHYKKGRYWVYNSYRQWKTDNFPFWSEATIKRTFSELAKKKLILTENLNKDRRDKTKWYTIDYDEVLILEQKCDEKNPQTQSESNDQSWGQIDQSMRSNCTVHEVKLTSPNNPTDSLGVPVPPIVSDDGTNLASSETTSETTSEIKSSVVVSSKVNSLDRAKKNDDDFEEEIFEGDLKTINNTGPQQNTDNNSAKVKEQTTPKEVGNEYFLSIEKHLDKNNVNIPLTGKSFAIVRKMYEGNVPIELVLKTITEVIANAKGKKIVSFKYFEGAIWENFNRKKATQKSIQMTEVLLEKRRLARQGSKKENG